jgi:hypothetical protein
VSEGIYKFEGDTLTICVGPPVGSAGRAVPRPPRFESGERSRTTLLTYRRGNPEFRLQNLYFPDYLVEGPSK